MATVVSDDGRFEWDSEKELKEVYNDSIRKINA